MRIYLAGQNGAHSIIPMVHQERREDMIVFLAGRVSGNLKPAWQKVAKHSDISLETLKEELINENFWRGGSHDIGYKM